MIFLKIFLIFLLIFESKEISEKNFNLLKDLIKHYSINTMYLVSENIESLDIYIQKFRNEFITFNIHTKNNREINFGRLFNYREVLLLTAKDKKSLNRILFWKHIFTHTDAILIVVSLPTKMFTGNVELIFRSSQILLIMAGETIKCSQMGNFFQPFTTAEEFIKTDPYEVPGLYLPKLKIDYKFQSIANFPLMIGEGVPTTGLIVYFKSAFEKYYENIRSRSFRKNYTNNDYVKDIYIDCKVSGVFEGYPLKSTKTCFMLPIIDEISLDEFMKKPFKNMVWILLIAFIIYFTIALRIVIFPDLFLSFFESLACSLGSIQRGIRNKVIYIQMFLYGFIIWNLYSAKLSSYLTTPYQGKPLKSLEDICNANITLLSDDSAYLRPGINLTDYVRRIRPWIFEFQQNTFKGTFDYTIDTAEFHNHLQEFDSNYGYLVHNIKWEFLDRSQSLLKRKLFSYSDICLDYGFLYPFISNDDRPAFNEIFRYFAIKTSENGLIFAWEQRTYFDDKFKFR